MPSAVAANRLLDEAAQLQEIEGNPLTPDELAMFEMFEREGWPPEVAASTSYGRSGIGSAPPPRNERPLGLTDPDALEAVFEVGALTNPRLRNEVGDIQLVLPSTDCKLEAICVCRRDGARRLRIHGRIDST
ncbi:MAG: hypothetical protein OXL68_11160 [Paracoccaceae bacterium]|nr:hypothetical protein [Paracoccaceae bacterium]